MAIPAKVVDLFGRPGGDLWRVLPLAAPAPKQRYNRLLFRPNSYNGHRNCVRATVALLGAALLRVAVLLALAGVGLPVLLLHSNAAQGSIEQPSPPIRIPPVNCGAAALLGLARCAAPARAEALIRVLAGDPRAMGAECSLSDLTTWARAAGISTCAVQGAPASLAELPLPAVIHLRPGHFALLLRVDSDSVDMAADSGEACRANRAAVEHQYTGYALCLSRRGVPDTPGVPAEGEERGRQKE